MSKDSLGDRMKNNYENRYRIYLTRRIPVIIRLDGKAFHTLTKHFEKPFDHTFTRVMNLSVQEAIKNIQGAKLAYVQSDEVSILLTDFDRLTTEAWFDYNLQKITSVSAAYMSNSFNDFALFAGLTNKLSVFDSRAFNIPKEEVTNYFIWRQQDWVRNSMQMLAQSHFSHKELHGKNQSDMHEMLHAKNINWADLPNTDKNGTCWIKVHNKWKCNDSIIFTKNREIIEKLLIPEEC